MNFFLLLCVPVGALLVFRLWYREFTLADLLRSGIYSLVASLLALVLIVVFHPWLAFNGDLLTCALGQTLVGALVAPGAITFAHLKASWAPGKGLLGSKETGLALGLTLCLLYTLVGTGDFLTTDRQSDAWDLFLLPAWRLFQAVALARIATRWWASRASALSWRWMTLLIALILAQPLLATLWFAGFGWAVAVLVPCLWALWIVLNLSAASWSSGTTSAIEEVPPSQT